MTPDKALAFIEWAKAHPIEWAKQTFGIEPWGKQGAILESVRDNRVTAARSCHAVGKSTIAAIAVLWFFTVFPRSIVLTTATSKRQVYGILWREIHALCRRAAKRGHAIGGHLTETKIKHDDDWWAWGFTAKDYDATTFQGFHAAYVLVIVDEAAGVKKDVWEGLDSAMSSGHARQLAIGNPTDGGGDFARMFDKDRGVVSFAISAFDSPNFTAFGVTVEDVRVGKKVESGPWKDKVTGPLPYPQLISPTWVREKWLDWCGGRKEGETDPRWQARVLGRFPEGGDNAVIPLSWVEEAHERWKEIQTAGAWAQDVRVGVDVARFGDDTTERAFFHLGQGVRDIVTAPKQDTMATVGTIVDDVRDLEEVRQPSGRAYRVTEVRVDADGLGAGVFDRLNELRPDIALEMRNGGRAQDPERYANRRSEWWWQLREALDPNGDAPIALPDDAEMTRQIVNVHWKLKSNGQKIIESKDEIRARIGRSTDKADAVIYANARFTDDGGAVTIDPTIGIGFNSFGDV